MDVSLIIESDEIESIDEFELVQLGVLINASEINAITKKIKISLFINLPSFLVFQ